jgi:hypothetical protein
LTLVVLLISALLFGATVVIGNRSGLVPTRWAQVGELHSLTVPAVVFVLVLAIDPSLVVTVLLGCLLGLVLTNIDRREERAHLMLTATIETVMNASWLTLVATAALVVRGLF